jgi:protoporphyrinogen oxidase
MKPKLVILGGGLSGLAAAIKLSKEYDVTILECQNKLGGLASSFEHQGEHIPKYYHHVVAHNSYTKKYLEKYSLLGGCVWKKIKVVIGVNKKLYNFNNIKGLLKFKFLSFWERIRFGFFGAYVIFLLNPNKLPEIDAQQWLNKVAGKGVTQKIFQNLYGRNKFNTTLDVISARQFANRLKEKEVYDDFTFPPKSLQPMIDGLEKDCLDNGVKIISSCAVQKVDLKNNIVHCKDYGQTLALKFDKLVNSIPLPVFLKIQEGLPEDYKKRLSSVKYCPCVSITFGTEDFLKPDLYWINLFQERTHVIMQHSVLADKYNTKVSWCLRYGGSEEDLNKSDEEIKQLYSADVKKYFPDAKIKWVRVFKDRYAEPLYDKYYASYMPRYETPLTNLFMTGIQVTYPRIRNMDAALESGEKVAEIILNKGKL